MQRVGHGYNALTSPSDALETAFEGLNATNFAASVGGTSMPFGYRFADLQANPASRLPETPETLDNLERLGATMFDRDSEPSLDSTIPAAYTYFGQFIDHDIAFSETAPPELSNPCLLTGSNLKPWSVKEVLGTIKNQRASLLNLDCVYGGDPAPPRHGRLMVIGKVSESGHRPQGKDEDNDLPRQGMSERFKKLDRAALIGDPRNDQNLIVSQLHLAFLRAHNAIASRGNSWEKTRTLLRQHYHWMIIHDYLKQQIADPNIVDRVLASSEPASAPSADRYFLPLEFTVAAFRFGHSTIRSLYYYNKNFRGGGLTLQMLLTLTALSDAMTPTFGKGFPTLPENRIIEWRRFLAGGENSTRRIDTRLSKPLFGLLDENEEPLNCNMSLPVLDLKRGYILRMPTGQAVAQALNLPFLTPSQIEEIVEKDNNPKQREVLASGFAAGTPLWFYVLAEAAKDGGNRLGPVGSHLVAEVLIGLIRLSKDSILDATTSWRPTLGSVAGKFNLTDLLRLAGVLED